MENTLVYGMAISVLLRHLNVDFKNDTLVIQPFSTYLATHSLHSMGYMQNDGGFWVKKGDRCVIILEELDLEGDKGNDGGTHYEEGDATARAPSSAFFLYSTSFCNDTWSI